MDTAQAVMASNCTRAYKPRLRSLASSWGKRVTTMVRKREEVSVTARPAVSGAAPVLSISNKTT